VDEIENVDLSVVGRGTARAGRWRSTGPPRATESSWWIVRRRLRERGLCSDEVARRVERTVRRAKEVQISNLPIATCWPLFAAASSGSGVLPLIARRVSP
jgi:hypothetical protein